MVSLLQGSFLEHVGGFGHLCRPALKLVSSCRASGSLYKDVKFNFFLIITFFQLAQQRIGFVYVSVLK